MSTHSKSLAEVVTSLTNESFALVNGAHFITLNYVYPRLKTHGLLQPVG